MARKQKKCLSIDAGTWMDSTCYYISVHLIIFSFFNLNVSIVPSFSINFSRTVHSQDSLHRAPTDTTPAGRYAFSVGIGVENEVIIIICCRGWLVAEI